MKFKKVLATTMAATMVMASAMTVCAADQYPNLVAANSHVLVAGDVNVTNITGDYSAESRTHRCRAKKFGIIQKPVFLFIKRQVFV